jgi:transcriptional regulator with XRE-family HTH domain
VGKAPTLQREAFAKRLEEARQRANKRRTQLAQDLGVHPNTVDNWVRGATDCPVGWVPDLAAALDVKPSALAFGDDNSAGSDTVAANDTAAFARRVIEVLERPLSTPDLMRLLSDARELAG